MLLGSWAFKAFKVAKIHSCFEIFLFMGNYDISLYILRFMVRHLNAT